MSKVNEKCACGATFVARGLIAQQSAEQWRLMHPCTVRQREYVWTVGDDRPRAGAFREEHK